MPEHVIEIDLDHTRSLMEALDAAARTFVMLNATRQQRGQRRVVARRVRIECEVVELTPGEVMREQEARATGYLEQAPFGSPEEVRVFFSRSVQTALRGAEASKHDDAQLEAMADVVLKTRRNCEF